LSPQKQSFITKYLCFPFGQPAAHKDHYFLEESTFFLCESVSIFHLTTTTIMLFPTTQRASPVLLMLLVCALGLIIAKAQDQDQQSLQGQQSPQLRAVTRQEDDARELGDVISISGFDDNSNNALDASSLQIDYSEELPVVHTGPYEGELPIDVDATAVSSSNEIIYTDRVVGGKESGPKSYYAMLLYQDTAGWKFAGCGGEPVQLYELLHELLS
jgi:hypothetical protein